MVILSVNAVDTLIVCEITSSSSFYLLFYFRVLKICICVIYSILFSFFHSTACYSWPRLVNKYVYTRKAGTHKAQPAFTDFPARDRGPKSQLHLGLWRLPFPSRVTVDAVYVSAGCCQEGHPVHKSPHQGVLLNCQGKG